MYGIYYGVWVLSTEVSFYNLIAFHGTYLLYLSRKETGIYMSCWGCMVKRKEQGRAFLFLTAQYDIDILFPPGQIYSTRSLSIAALFRYIIAGGWR